MTTKEDQRAIRAEWRRDRIRDTFREAGMDEEQLETLQEEIKDGRNTNSGHKEPLGCPDSG